MLLTVTEDKATLRSDLSADYGGLKQRVIPSGVALFLYHSLRKS